MCAPIMQQLSHVLIRYPIHLHPIVARGRLAEHDRGFPVTFGGRGGGEAEDGRAGQGDRDAVGDDRGGDFVAWMAVLRVKGGGSAVAGGLGRGRCTLAIDLLRPEIG